MLTVADLQGSRTRRRKESAMRTLFRGAALVSVLISLLIGCGETDPRVAQVALESTRRQAEQNRQMGELQQHVAEGTKQLVDADAQARQQLAELQRELRSDQAEIGRQRDALESERRTIATERRWDSILGTSIYAGAGILACLLPLLLCG